MTMRPITRRSALAGTATLASAVALTACDGGGDDPESQKKLNEPDDNFHAEGMPIVDEPVTLKFMTARYNLTAEDWNKVASMEEMEKISNVHIDWGFIPWEGRDEKRNLALASGDYPEVLHRTALNAADIAKYGEEGTFLALNDAIDKYMPNLTALLDEYPDMRKGLTQPDDNIYSLPTIYDPDFDSLNMQHQLWVRNDWLDAFGMEPPETLDEFEAYLQEVKNGDPNGNGKNDEIPYATSNDSLFIQIFHSTFGIANRGMSAGSIDADDDGNLRFWRTSDGYREELEYVHGLYDQGLIQEDIFAPEPGKFMSLGKDDLYGAVGSQAPKEDFGKKIGEKYVALTPLKKSAGDEIPTWNLIYSPLKMIGQFVITDKAEHPLEACRWMDYFYGDDGARLFFIGVEGESYEKTDNGYELLPEITDNPDGLTVDEAIKPYVTYLGGSYAGFVKEEYFQSKEGTAQAREGTKAVAEYKTEEVWPVFTYSSEEASELSGITVDIDKLVSESEAKFITGEMDTSSDWDTYVQQFEQMGVDRYMEIQQAAFDRYQG